MVFEVKSKKPLEEIDQGLKDSAARHQFGIIAVHDLKQTMAKKGVEFSGECMIYEVCNPHKAKAVLEANASISTALPCRISVYRTREGYNLATLLPTAVLGMFGNPELEPVAREVEEIVVAMMQESA